MNFWQDVRFGLRMLRRSPGFALVAVLTFGIGVGVTSAVYSICDAMLWKPVALPNLETLVMILEREPGSVDDWNALTPADMEDIRQNNRTLDNIASWQGGVANIVTANSRPEAVLQARVSTNFFDALEVKPALGRGFEADEDQPGREREVILSSRLWENRFGADRHIIGETIRLDGQNFVVIGVMADSFDFPLATEVWTPNVLTPEDRASRRLNKLNGLARLKPRYTLAQAATELDGLGTHLEVIYPDTNKNRRFMLREAHRFFVNYQREQYLLMLLGSVLFVLLIACVNVANLQFARATGRLREMGIRVALGASRKQIIRQLVTESVLLSVPSAALGLLVADWGMNLIKAGMPPELVRFVHGWKEIQLDERVLIATLIAALLSSFLAGLVPAWQCSRPNVIDALREGGRSGSAGHSRNLLRNLLVTAEIIFAVVLLVGAGLMVRGFRAQVDSGARLEPATLLTMRLAMTDHQSREPHQIANFYREVLDRISGLPGINSIAAVTALPYSGHSDSGVFTIEGRQREPNNLPRSMRQVVSPSYFDTLHIPLQDGRLLLSSDGPDAPKVALISERLAARWWQGQSPLGQHIQVGEPDPKSPWYTIVGVVGDLMHSPYDREPRPAIYLSYQQAPTPWMDISVRTAGDPMLMVPQITSAIHQVDPEQPVTDIRSMEQAIRNSAIGLNYMAVLMGVFGLLALALSALGVYGVMAYLVSEQTREIGIRMALGAQRQNVLSLILRRGLRPVAAGLILGLPLAWGFSHLLASVIYGVAANDIATFVGVPSSLILAALLAVYFPAWRATKIDPIVALRYE